MGVEHTNCHTAVVLLHEAGTMLSGVDAATGQTGVKQKELNVQFPVDV